MTRAQLLNDLKRHDWYYMYSDDHGVWKRGSENASRLCERLAELDCPFQWWDINKAISGAILENHVEVNPGEYRDPTWKYDCIASRKRDDLLTQAEVDKILEWFNA
jgi:hypothetical protein